VNEGSAAGGRLRLDLRLLVPTESVFVMC